MSDSRRRRIVHLPLARRVPRDVDAELRFHLEERIEELMSEHHLSRAEAEALAEQKFGDVRRVRAELEAIDRAGWRRRARGEWLAALVRDARVGLRALGRSPGFTAAAVLTVALAIGANTAIFSAVDAVLLKPIPAAALDRLVVVRQDLPKVSLTDADLSPADGEDLIARRDLFESATAYTRRRPTLTEMGEPRQLASARTIGRFFDTFEVRPLLGRTYRPDESEPGSAPVVVLGWAAWQELYGGDPNVVGRTMRLGGTTTEIVGVLPREFRHPLGTDVYQPLEMDQALRSPQGRGRLFMTFVGRLRPDADARRLRDAFAAQVRAWSEGDPSVRAVSGEGPLSRALVATPFVEHHAGRLRPVLAVLMGAVVLVLLIACANVASLQLVRSAGRAREIAVRAALGARRGGIVRQLLVESLLLALAGGALGLLLGQAIVAGLAHAAPAQFPQLEGLALDGRVLAFTAAVAVGAGLLFGLLPAVPASRADLAGALKAGGSRTASASGAHRRLLQGSVVVQVALTLVLLLGSALVVRSLSRLLALDPGFSPERVMTMKVVPPGDRYRGEALTAFYREVADRAAALPGVQAAGVVFGLPFTGDEDSSPFDVPGLAKAPGAPDRHAEYRVIAGDYFGAMGIPVLRGRAFGPGDGAGATNVVVVDESLAREYFGDVDPVGRQLKQLGSANGDTWTIVGVVRGVMRAELGERLKPTIYYHHAQVPWYSGLALAVRGTAEPTALAGALRATTRALEPGALVTDVRSMQERIDRSLGARRLAVWVLSGFAALALVLAVLGVYGVISYGVAQRRHEIGIRMALGATARDVTRMVVGQGLALAGVGLAAGLVAFLALGRLLEALLYGVGPRDPATLVLVAATVTVAAAAAAWVPGQRAGRLGAGEVLRG